MTKRSWSKWSKHKSLMRNAKLIPHLPKTYTLKKSSFWSLLDKYGEVIVKPTGSWGGKGVLSIRYKEGEYYEVQDGAARRLVAGDGLYRYIQKKTSKNYLVQQRIDLATVKHRPFDLRVMVQRRSKSKWQVTGKLAKIAGKGYVVTNIRRSSGRVKTIEYALHHSNIEERDISRIIAHIDHVALLAAEQLRKHYPDRRTLGIDMAVDRKGNVWIIEVNFTPMKGLFRKLKDHSMYRRIVSF